MGKPFYVNGPGGGQLGINPREKNNYFVSGNIGYEFIFSNNKFLFDYKDGESKAIADQYGYKQEKYLISYFRYFDFGTFNLSKSFTENEYEIADTFVLSSTVRDDELDTTSISLNGELVNLYFLNKFKFFEDIFVFFNNSSFTKFDSFSDTLRLLILIYFSCIALEFVPHLYFCLRALLLRRKSISFQSVML